MKKENASTFLQMLVRISRHITEYEITDSGLLLSCHCFRYHSKDTPCANKTPHNTPRWWEPFITLSNANEDLERVPMRCYSIRDRIYDGLLRSLSTPAWCPLPLRDGGLHEQNTSGWSARLLFLEDAMGNQCFLSNKQDPKTWIQIHWMDVTGAQPLTVHQVMG